MDTKRSEELDSPDSNVETLELRAMRERSKLHESVEELKQHYSSAKEKLDVKKNVRQHMMGTSVLVTVFGLASGYAIAGAFTRH